MKKWQKNHKIKADYLVVRNIAFDRPTDHTVWSNSEYDELKKHIKFHYSVMQNDTCAYCREPIRFDGYGEPIEHIVPKNHAPGWMFEPKNLCLSCYGCNTKKSVKVTLIGGYNIGQTYPITTNSFNIIHPHFDVFSTCIDSKELLFKPKNNNLKGKNTIEFCKLNRPDLLFKRALNSRNTEKNMLSFAFKTLRSGNENNEEKVVARDFILALLKRVRYYNEVESELG